MRNLHYTKAPKNLWIVEFSPRQQAFSVRELGEAAIINLDLFFRAKPSDQAVVGVAGSEREGQAIAAALGCRANQPGPFDNAAAEAVASKLISLGVMQAEEKAAPPVG